MSWDKFNKIMGGINSVVNVGAKLTGVIGGVAVGVGGFKMAKRRQARQELNEDRAYELEKMRLENDFMLENKRLNRDSEFDRMKLESETMLENKRINRESEVDNRKIDADIEITRMRESSNIARTNTMYGNGSVQPNLIYDNVNGVMTDNRFANNSIMNSTTSSAHTGSGKLSFEQVQQKLLELNELKKQGLIDDNEFNSLKKNILSSM